MESPGYESLEKRPYREGIIEYLQKYARGIAGESELLSDYALILLNGAWMRIE